MMDAEEKKEEQDAGCWSSLELVENGGKHHPVRLHAREGLTCDDDDDAFVLFDEVLGYG
jgi:hypothetical protein